jgi:predicted DNA-binding transcriptional regulator YafY
MPVNKNAMTRYRILDELLQNPYHDYSLDDMTAEVNSRLGEMGIDPVTRRCIENDIHYIEWDGPFEACIKRYSVPCYNYDKKKTTPKRCLRYEDASFSIFTKELSDDEAYLLKEALSMLGQFEGLPNMKGLQSLSFGLAAKESRKKIVSFTRNPLENSSVFGQLFNAISQKQVVEIHYHTFAHPEQELLTNVIPYQLKEYNRRWFLFSASEEDGKVLTFALDRVDKTVPLPSHQYREYDGDPNEWFDDIIGVTLYEGRPVEHILFWVNERSKDYVMTKPLHDSQIVYKGEREEELHKKYPALEKGKFFSIDCKENYELIRELASFGADLLVLSPQNIQDEIFERINAMLKDYRKLRT